MIQAQKIGLCQSHTDCPLSLALSVNHARPTAIHRSLRLALRYDVKHSHSLSQGTEIV